jgi:hypothetical protein
MRVVLAAAAVVTAGALAGALALALRTPQAARAGRAAASAPAHATTRSPSGRTGGPARPVAGRASTRYSFSTLDNPADATFNQLLGVSNLGHIAGYSGSGAAGHPYRGYILRPPYRQARYQAISVPGSAQTQLTGLNNTGIQVGFWSAQNKASQVESNVGFYLRAGRFASVRFPTRDNASPPVNQLLGVNDHGIAVGFYTDGQGRHHGYRYDIATRTFAVVAVPGGSSVIAAAINNSGGVAGFFTGRNGVTSGFFLRATGQLFILNAPHAAMTQALGVSDSGEVVGGYRLGSGSRAATHGFTWTPQRGFTTVDDPRGVGTTTINGVNDAGDLVGFYVDGPGNTDGLLATPGR